MHAGPVAAAIPEPPLEEPWRVGAGVMTALGSFIVLGTVSALWPNPLFVRMTQAGNWEIAALVAGSLLAGVFVAVRPSACPTRPAGAGGIAGFLGIACPTCNKLLMLVFGGELLLTYFDPVRPLFAAAGVAVLGFAVARALAARRQLAASAPHARRIAEGG